MARQHHTARGQSNKLEGDERASWVYGKASRGLGEKLYGRTERNIRELHVASQKQLSVVFDAVKPPKATSWQSRASAGDRQRLCDGGKKLERIVNSGAHNGFKEIL